MLGYASDPGQPSLALCLQRFGIETGIALLEQLVCFPLHMYFLLSFKLFMNNVNDIRAFSLSQYAATSVTEVSNVDVDFTEARLMLILYQQHSPIDLLLLIILILAGLNHHVKGLLSYRKLMSWHFSCSILDQEFVIYL